MKSTYKAAVAAVMVMILLTNPALLAWGKPPPGRWEKAIQTKPGEKITVYTKDGAKRKYLYVQIEDDFLTCANKYSGNIPVELATIDKIIVSKAGKYAKHGILWGALVGAGAMGIAYQLEPHSDPPWGGIIFGAGAGAVSGLLAGAAVGAPGETIYISKEKALAEAR